MEHDEIDVGIDIATQFANDTLNHQSLKTHLLWIYRTPLSKFYKMDFYHHIQTCIS